MKRKLIGIHEIDFGWLVKEVKKDLSLLSHLGLPWIVAELLDLNYAGFKDSEVEKRITEIIEALCELSPEIREEYEY